MLTAVFPACSLLSGALAALPVYSPQRLRRARTRAFGVPTPLARRGEPSHPTLPIRSSPLGVCDCLQGGADDIKKHKWFSELNFEKIYNREEEAPIKPEVANASDTSNFECARRHLPRRASCHHSLKLRHRRLPAAPSPPHARAFLPSVRRKYPDSAEGSTNTIDERDQALFSDF